MVGWRVHRSPKLLRLLLGELEGIVDLTTHIAAGREGVDLTQLLRLEQAHVNVLLMCGSNLLLLLLEQLNLLLDGQLFH